MLWTVFNSNNQQLFTQQADRIQPAKQGTTQANQESEKGRVDAAEGRGETREMTTRQNRQRSKLISDTLTNLAEEGSKD